ncbi:MAG TPA: UDP-N-acetylmuramoyl-L-alanine--D-glutamate ligase [Candidatus Saccharimonadales bacterium]|jgi:UDP-N-acetylmuramoylalanine--D-glutamate ligase
MKVALVGFAVEGRAAFEYWSRLGANITVCDQDFRKKVPDGAGRQLGENYLKNLDHFDVVWRTAGINPQIILDANPDIADKITTTMNEFLRVCPTKHVIGVTGTKGKGTTSTLIAKMLEAAGEEVFLGGNIGVSPFDFLPKLTENSWVVLELSSFQLVDLKRSPAIAVCLMVVPEHLNWHADMDEYILAKAQLFEHQTASDTAIYYAKSDDSRKVASYSSGLKIPYFAEPGAHVENDTIIIAGERVCDTDELKLLGEHNWQNACAALTAVWQITQNSEAIRSALTAFSGLPHRLEFVREVDGIKYYDDSFGTGPETAIVAIEAFEQPKVVILGGSDKGVRFDQLAKTIAGQNVRQVILIGETAPKIEAALRQAGVSAITSGGTTMPEMVAAAKSAAQPGDVVLLSPACASFDLFQNYKDRANQFERAVQAL